MYGYTYLITNLINGHQYVGQHQYELPELDPNYFGSGELLKKKIKQYGIENFSIELLELCNNQDELNDAETRGIYKYKTFVDWGYGGYNLTTGGGGYKRSEELNKQVSNTMLLLCKTEKIKTQRKKSQTIRWNNENNKKIQSQKQIERYKDPKEHEKTSIAIKKSLESDEARKKWGEMHRNPKSNSKIVLQYDINNKFIKEYPSAAEAFRQTKIYNIKDCCLDYRKQAGGYIWKYKE